MATRPPYTLSMRSLCTRRPRGRPSSLYTVSAKTVTSRSTSDLLYLHFSRYFQPPIKQANWPV